MPFLAIRSISIGNVFCQELQSSCHELLIQWSVVLLAANHQIDQVVFNVLVEDRLSSSPSTVQEWCLTAVSRKTQWPKPVNNAASFTAVSGLADLPQAAVPESKGKINTAACTGSWGRFGATLPTQSFLLTNVNSVSQQPDRWPSKRTCCFLGNRRECTAATARVDAYIFLMKCTHAACLLSNDSLLGSMDGFWLGCIFCCSLLVQRQDKAPPLALG